MREDQAEAADDVFQQQVASHEKGAV